MKLYSSSVVLDALLLDEDELLEELEEFEFEAFLEVAVEVVLLPNLYAVPCKCAFPRELV